MKVAHVWNPLLVQERCSVPGQGMHATQELSSVLHLPPHGRPEALKQRGCCGLRGDATRRKKANQPSTSQW